ncbi:MAG: hypothetical protein A2293_14955 [Elusimicrobia bacterium RIFOXYB2_FULL_49_7]|nr:MAG: hypothetical protein A2293_14955 [Elusimicrobia bacterium RIFOXYB2_FULL_49_7]
MGLAKIAVLAPPADDQSKRKITIQFMESAVTAGMPFIGEPICSFESGLIAGVLGKLYKRKLTVIETKCVAMGHEYCQFEAETSERHHGGSSHDCGFGMSYSEENMELISSLASHAVTTIQNAIRYENTKRMVITDPLTKTYNYGYFQSRLKEEIHRASRQRHAVSLVMVDLDCFKKLNDLFGHPTGDRILKEVARIIKDSIRTIDIVCRYGGDEFALILPQTDREETIKVLERMRLEIEHHNFSHATKHTVPHLAITATFGCSMYPRDGHNPDLLIELADKALYDAKHAGRNQLRFFEDTNAEPVRVECPATS